MRRSSPYDRSKVVSSQPCAARSSMQVRPTDAQELAALLRADMGSASAPGVPGRDGSAAPPMEPEPKAVLWAKRNRWFGTDQVRHASSPGAIAKCR